MLAHTGLALITEKLQNQRLEETVVQPVLGAARLPQVGCDCPTKSAGQARNNLAVKGKNVWALSLESERPLGRDGNQHGFGPAIPLSSDTPVPSTVAPQRAVGPLPRSLHQTEKLTINAPWSCRHKKQRQSCYLCDSGSFTPGTPSAPPKKKHCRSLSVPPDSSGGSSSNAGFLPTAVPAPTTAREAITQGRLWKPIAVIPLSGLNRDNKPPEEQDVPQTRWQPLPKLPDSDFKLVPSLPSGAASCSSDSGHFTTSDLQTPPCSPLGGVLAPNPVRFPRPSSAASDTTGSCSPWLDCGPAATNYTSGSGWSHNNLRSSLRSARTLQNRSLSCEDRISGCSSSSSCSSPYANSLGKGAASAILAFSSNSSGVGGVAGSSNFPAASTPRCRSGSHDVADIVDGCGSLSGSVSNIPRCHSQPCVLHHRRCGKKRRRNCDRPTLNFNKMTETAYVRGNRHSDPWVGTMPTFVNHINVLGLNKPLEINCTGTGGGGGRLGFALNTIASSPLDSDLIPTDAVVPSSPTLPLPPSPLPAGRDQDLRQAASIALPLTPPEHASPAFPFTRQNARQQHHEGLEVDEEGEEEGDEDEEGEGDEEEEDEYEDGRNHSNCRCHSNRSEDDIGLVFPMTDLDLEQIENH